MAIDVTPWIHRYVDGLVTGRRIRTGKVEQAFRQVPRHRCIVGYHLGRGRYVEVPQGDEDEIPDDVLDYIYSDSAPVTKVESGRPVSSSSAAWLVAEMLEALEMRGGERVLEVGAGTGYNAALLAQVTGAQVFTVDHAPDVAAGARASLARLGERRVTVVTTDGYHGYRAGAPYDRIVATVGVPGVADPWMEQLAPQGFVLAPVAVAGRHPVIRVDRAARVSGETTTGRGVCWTGFMGGAGSLAHRDVRTFTSSADWGPFAMRAPRIVHRFDPPLDDRVYEDLTAFVSVSDRRAGPRVIKGLHPDDGTCAIRDRDGAIAAVQRWGVTVDGPKELERHVVDLVDAWTRLGRPRFADWTCRLGLRQLAGGHYWVPERWSVGGRALTGG